MITIEEQIACVERELAYRRRVYERRVREEKMTQKLADRELERMTEVLYTLRKVQREEQFQLDLLKNVQEGQKP